jgi:transposase
MNEKNLDEIAYRRRAFKLFDKGKSAGFILALIPRSRSWLFKWKQRFDERGWKAFDSLPKAPQSSPHQYNTSVVQMVIRMRKRLEKSKVGLVGARAIWQELRRRRLLRTVPSIPTLKRWLRQANLTHGQTVARESPYYPAVRIQPDRLVLSCDWLARYLEGGLKVFVFHTIDLHSHALAQTIFTDKTTDSACAHLLESSMRLGLPDFLQIDNDAAFTGLGKKERVFGRFVRLALYLGMEIIFIPPGEPKRNHTVERVNGLWVSSFWDKNHFAGLTDLLKKSPQFMDWYEEYAPPALHGLTVREARKKQGRPRKLKRQEIEKLPTNLPLTAGRIHFVRRVDNHGKVEILKESWRVSKRLTGEYVWVSIDLRCQSLFIYHRRSDKANLRLVKTYAYQVNERIEKLKPEYRPRARRLSIAAII